MNQKIQMQINVHKQRTSKQVMESAIESQKILFQEKWKQLRKWKLLFMNYGTDQFVNKLYGRDKIIKKPQFSQMKKSLTTITHENYLQNFFLFMKGTMLHSINIAIDQNALTTQLGMSLYSTLCGQDKGKLNRQAAEIFVKNFRVCMDQKSVLEQANLFMSKLKKKQNYITEQDFIELFKHYGLSSKQKQMIIRNQSISLRDRLKQSLKIKDNFKKKMIQLTKEPRILSKRVINW